MDRGHPIRRLLAAAATPLDHDLRCDCDLLVAHARALLTQGCDGVVLFGTTGEGPCFSVAERRAALERVLEAGIPAERVAVGTAATAPADALALGRHALACGVRELLVMPPFFLRAAARPGGVLRFYQGYVGRLGDPRARVLLYHFPEVSGAAITPALARGLRQAFGEVVAGVKDSGGVLDDTLALIEELPELAIYTGTEVQVPEVVRRGGAGTVCGLANLAPRELRVMLEAEDERTVEAMRRRVADLDALLCAEPFVPALKAALAEVYAVPEWVRVVPPLSPIDERALERLRLAFAAWRAAAPG
jgi:4-hydroxy-tetrahydrodipicolinate synthase